MTDAAGHGCQVERIRALSLLGHSRAEQARALVHELIRSGVVADGALAALDRVPYRFDYQGDALAIENGIQAERARIATLLEQEPDLSALRARIEAG